MTTLESLKQGRARIATGWCRGKLANDKDGLTVDPGDPTACSWCAAGAVDDRAAEVFALNTTRGASGGLYRWNDADARVRDDVLDLYDRTIARLEATP